MSTDRSDHGLQFVAAFAADTDFVTLDLSRDFVFSIANEGGDFFRDRLLESLLDFDGLPGMAQRGDIRFTPIDVFEADVSFCEFINDDFVNGPEFE